MKKRVLEILGGLGIGGNEIFVMNLYRTIDKSKFEISFLIFGDDNTEFIEEIRKNGDQVLICPNENTKTFILRMKYVYKILKTHCYDVVHCHSCSFKGLLVGTIPARFARVHKVISHSHNSGTPKHTVIDDVIRYSLKKVLCMSIDYGLACSDVAGESKYTKKFINTDKYHIIRNAIDIEKYKFNSQNRKIIRDKYNFQNQIVIGNIGRLSIQKNQEFLIRIFSYINNINKNTRLLIVGDGDLLDKLKKISTELALSDKIIFAGSVLNPEMYYSAMDVFVMTSLFEGLPFTAVEAQVNGLRCAFSDSITQMVNISKENEFLSLNDEVEKWGKIILNLATSRCNIVSCNYVCDNYNLENEVKKIEKIYL